MCWRYGKIVCWYDLLDRPDDEPVLVSMDRVVKCSEKLPETSWLGRKKTNSKPDRQDVGRNLLAGTS